MKFTVFTPTYNRRHTIGRVYESLKNQSLKDFEWLIVDDGSTDNTKDLIREWQCEAAFPIRYVWQPNGHKKTAFNHGVSLAKGELFIVADSDDTFFPQTLERFLYHWHSIPEYDREHFAGVCGLCEDEKGSVVGDLFTQSWGIDSDSLEIRYRYRVKGEKWGVMRTDVLRAHPFPEFIPGHVPESVVWSSIAAQYKIRFVNEVFRVYFQDSRGRLMQEANPANSAAGLLYWKCCVLNNELQWFWYNPIFFLLEASRWSRFRLHISGHQNLGVDFLPRNIVARYLVFIMAPLGFLWWGVDVIKARVLGRPNKL